jgi:hypothetical protein
MKNAENREPMEFCAEMKKMWSKVAVSKKSSECRKLAATALDKVQRHTQFIWDVDNFDHDIASKMKSTADMGLTCANQEQGMLLIMQRQMLENQQLLTTAGPSNNQPFSGQRGFGARKQNTPNFRNGDGNDGNRRGPRFNDVCRSCGQRGHWWKQCKIYPYDPSYPYPYNSYTRR